LGSLIRRQFCPRDLEISRSAASISLGNFRANQFCHDFPLLRFPGQNGWVLSQRRRDRIGKFQGLDRPAMDKTARILVDKRSFSARFCSNFAVSPKARFDAKFLRSGH
jgi:hypothetical protein